MPKYVIEREMPGVGEMSDAEVRGASEDSCSALRDLGPRIVWQQSYVADDKIYCVYIAPDEELIREHAQRVGIPADRISRVRRVIDPSTAEPATVA